MMRLVLSGMAFAICLLTLPASAGTVNVYTIGSNPAGEALDPVGNPIGGIPLITWNQVGTAGLATLSIVAEGIDTNEFDEVFFNGSSIGFLTSQGFQVGTFNLNPGPGAMADGSTALTVSVFNVTALAGVNTVSVQLDTEYWVNEIETSTLLSTSTVPEPSTVGMLAAGVGMLAWALRRRGKA